MTNENAPFEARLWKELRWWLLSGTVLTIVAAVCVAYLGQLYDWGGHKVLIALGILPFVAEAWIQFRSWWRHILWITAGVLIALFVVNVFLEARKPLGGELPAWFRGPAIFLLPACIEFTAASSERKRPWIWLIVTPALFGLSEYWMEPLFGVLDRAMNLVVVHVPFSNRGASELYIGAAIFGTVLFTRALTGSLIASRRRF
jgi:hypothetical protein